MDSKKKRKKICVNFIKVGSQLASREVSLYNVFYQLVFDSEGKLNTQSKIKTLDVASLFYKYY